MRYKVIVVSAMRGMSTNFENGARELKKKVNQELKLGWEPQGGVTIGNARQTNEPYLLQALVKRPGVKIRSRA